MPQAIALTIAGSDPSGGAGLQADLKTFQQLGVFGMSFVTLLTVQNSMGGSRVELVSPDLIVEQLSCVLNDIPPTAIKTGALGSHLVVEHVATALEHVECPIVVDPVLVSKHGHSLANDDVVVAYFESLLPLATLITPNRFEAERLTGFPILDEPSAMKAMERFHDRGVQNVLLKFGLSGEEMVNFLSLNGECVRLTSSRLAFNNTHGTGCVLSAAIAAKLASGELNLESAVSFGIARTHESIQVDIGIGHGIRPVDVRRMSRN
ncbi:MAG TPA: bifunctional hydroxymethylpyrimidine kinase/phosphomethylpyrimidine kinase [Pirellulaceae bacterium]|nr:bifunctional hydroxymethylpyrimidine kinase/phosphomethylpyrimidine kinase [Pirellulaceae bacterium]